MTNYPKRATAANALGVGLAWDANVASLWVLLGFLLGFLWVLFGLNPNKTQRKPKGYPNKTQTN